MNNTTTIAPPNFDANIAAESIFGALTWGSGIMLIMLALVVIYSALTLVKERRQKKSEEAFREVVRNDVARAFNDKLDKMKRREEKRLKGIRRDVTTR